MNLSIGSCETSLARNPCGLPEHGSRRFGDTKNFRIPTYFSQDAARIETIRSTFFHLPHLGFIFYFQARFAKDAEEAKMNF
jgi:hypothetical protein